MTKFIEPSIALTAFNCPHCGVLTTQTWYRTHVQKLHGDKAAVPHMPDMKWLNGEAMSDEDRAELKPLVERFLAGYPFLVTASRADFAGGSVGNLFISSCYDCSKLALWVHKSLIYPPLREGPQANPDLPEEIRRDFEEARAIVNASPRGAAALLRLCVQKLCKHFGEPGKDINTDIKNLVLKGMSDRLQRALDIVRVVGNEAVHPGELDLRDDRDTALHLFALINAIVDQMITHPKTVDELYARLPQSKLEGIANRDKRP